MNEYEEYEEQFNRGEIENAIQGEFVIDNDSKAEWALKKIKEAQDEHDRIHALIDAEAKRLLERMEKNNKKLDADTSYLKYLLNNYMNTVKCKETKTQRTYQLLSGKLIRKKGTIDYIRDEDKLLEWTKQNKPDLVKTKYSVDWSTLKKSLTVTPKGEVITDEGELLDCITTEIKPDKFEIKF